ncbi:oxygenase [Phragmitibacter flavus]|uniref:Oxygenase n=1 Tax=Phragmitibacter flavus TaxID=2576071 RepID=A0A5R8KHH9_9BACT|nr:2OG-Fe(II) oxygenase [Phragmitibacter flavus]TLD71701.1 oxygenase [Phragmitibacter flavus]
MKRVFANSQNSAEWLQWARENLERGCDLKDICHTIRTSGPMCLKLPTTYPPNNQYLLHPSQAAYDYFHSSQIIPKITRPEGVEDFVRMGNGNFQLFLGVHFLSHESCELLTEKISSASQQSTLTVPESDKDFRTSMTCHLASSDDKQVGEVDAMIAHSLGINSDYSEPIQGQMYSEGQQFKLHTDYFEPRTEEFKQHANEKGQRTWTFMIYLSKPNAGGFTYFSALDINIPCDVGTAIAWNNLRSDGSVNPYSIHEGTKIVSGKKTVITKWFRDKGNGQAFFSR